MTDTNREYVVQAVPEGVPSPHNYTDGMGTVGVALVSTVSDTNQ